MRIRTQNLLFIVPIFAGLAIPISLFSYRGQVAEIHWGMAEGLQALTLVTAEFLDAQACADLAAGHEPAAGAALARLRTPLQRVGMMDPQKQRLNLQQEQRRGGWAWAWRHLPGRAAGPDTSFVVWESLRRMTLLAPDGERVLLDMPVAADVAATPPSLQQLAAAAAAGRARLYHRTADDRAVALEPEERRGPDGLLQALERRGAVYAEAYQNEAGRRVASGWAAVLHPSGEPAAVLAIETDAASFGVQRQVAGVQAVAISAGIILCGVLVALAISGVVARGVRALSQVATAAVAGDYGQRVGPQTVAEMADLGKTFGTMTSVLQEVVSRTRRELIDSEQFRSDADLARTYAELYSAPQEGHLGGLQVGIRQVSDRPSGDFCGGFEAGGRAYVVLGRVAGLADLDAVTLASAAFTYMRGTLACAVPEQVLAEAVELFDVETCLCVSWRPGDGSVHWVACSGAPGAPLSRGTLSLEDGACAVFHSLEGQSGAMAESYARLFKHLPPAQLAADLAAVLGDPACGTVAALGRGTAA